MQYKTEERETDNTGREDVAARRWRRHVGNGDWSGMTWTWLVAMPTWWGGNEHRCNHQNRTKHCTARHGTAAHVKTAKFSGATKTWDKAMMIVQYHYYIRPSLVYMATFLQP